MTPEKPILIIGAGISSLALAQSLLTSRIPFHIYKRDPSLYTRPQGYRFRLNSPGITALTSFFPSSLLTHLKASCPHISNTTPQSFYYLDALNAFLTRDAFILAFGSKDKNDENDANADGPKLQTSYTEEDSLNIDREVICSLLITNLEPYITFSKLFERYETIDFGITVWFKDGTNAEGCLLIGADGVKSRVRRQLLPEMRLLDTTCNQWNKGL